MNKNLLLSLGFYLILPLTIILLINLYRSYMIRGNVLQLELINPGFKNRYRKYKIAISITISMAVIVLAAFTVIALNQISNSGLYVIVALAVMLVNFMLLFSLSLVPFLTTSLLFLRKINKDIQIDELNRDQYFTEGRSLIKTIKTFSFFAILPALVFSLFQITSISDSMLYKSKNTSLEKKVREVGKGTFGFENINDLNQSILKDIKEDNVDNLIRKNWSGNTDAEVVDNLIKLQSYRNKIDESSKLFFDGLTCFQDNSGNMFYSLQFYFPNNKYYESSSSDAIWDAKENKYYIGSVTTEAVKNHLETCSLK